MWNVRRLLVYLVAWTLAAIAVVTVAWLGFRTALGAAVPARGTVLSAADLRSVVPATSSAVPSPPPSRTPTPSPDPSPSSSTPAPTKSSATPAETWTPVPDGFGGGGYRRTVHTSGGDAVVWASPGTCRILETNPRTGWSVTLRQDSSDSATVVFQPPTGRGHSIRVTVEWGNGPVVEAAEAFGYGG